MGFGDGRPVWPETWASRRAAEDAEEERKAAEERNLRSVLRPPLGVAPMPVLAEEPRVGSGRPRYPETWKSRRQAQGRDALSAQLDSEKSSMDASTESLLDRGVGGGSAIRSGFKHVETPEEHDAAILRAARADIWPTSEATDDPAYLTPPGEPMRRQSGRPNAPEGPVYEPDFEATRRDPNRPPPGSGKWASAEKSGWMNDGPESPPPGTGKWASAASAGLVVEDLGDVDPYAPLPPDAVGRGFEERSAIANMISEADRKRPGIDLRPIHERLMAEQARLANPAIVKERWREAMGPVVAAGQSALDRESRHKDYMASAGLDEGLGVGRRPQSGDKDYLASIGLGEGLPPPGGSGRGGTPALGPAAAQEALASYQPNASYQPSAQPPAPSASRPRTPASSGAPAPSREQWSKGMNDALGASKSAMQEAGVIPPEMLAQVEARSPLVARQLSQMTMGATPPTDPTMGDPRMDAARDAARKKSGLERILNGARTMSAAISRQPGPPPRLDLNANEPVTNLMADRKRQADLGHARMADEEFGLKKNADARAAVAEGRLAIEGRSKTERATPGTPAARRRKAMALLAHPELAKYSTSQLDELSYDDWDALMKELDNNKKNANTSASNRIMEKARLDNIRRTDALSKDMGKSAIGDLEAVFSDLDRLSPGLSDGVTPENFQLDAKQRVFLGAPGGVLNRFADPAARDISNAVSDLRDTLGRLRSGMVLTVREEMKYLRLIDDRVLSDPAALAQGIARIKADLAQKVANYQAGAQYSSVEGAPSPLEMYESKGGTTAKDFARSTVPTTGAKFDAAKEARFQAWKKANGR